MAYAPYRDRLRDIAPSWLRSGIAGKILFAFGLMLDVLIELTTASITYRFPGVYGPDSLPYIGRDRRIRRGRSEPNANYAARLTTWLDLHATRGGPYALLEQLHAYYAFSGRFPISLVYETGRCFTLDPDTGAITYTDLASWTSDNPAKWARWTLYYEWPEPVEDDGLWGDAGTWGEDDFLWGVNLSIDDAADIRLIPQEWNAGHPLGRIYLMHGEADVWGFPPGLWGEDVEVWGGTGRAVALAVN
jgi:hypothetical protein